MSKQLPTRSQIPVEDTWDLTVIFKNDEEWEAEFEELSEMIPESNRYEGILGESAENLLAALQFRDILFQRLAKLYVYAHLNEDTDTRNSYYQGLSARAANLMTQASAAFAFFSSEVMELDEQLVKSYVNDNKELSLYKQEFDELFLRRPYILSQGEEEILAKSGEPLDATTKAFAVLNNADLKFPAIDDENGNSVQITHGSYVKLLEGDNKNIRRDAYKGMLGTYGALKNTFAATLSGTVKANNFIADVRGFDSARHHALFSNFIPESVYDSLIEAVNDNMHLLHRYVDLRKKVLGLDEIHMYDMYTPMVEKVEMSFTFEEAKNIIIDALSVLGEEYTSILKRAFDERWIDPIENQSKRSGAYSSGAYGTNPYILMNWQDNLENVYTLAHELGHSVHSYYSRSTQPYQYSGYSIFLAEIVSTTNENLLTEYLLKKYDDPKIQAYIINHYLDGFKGTVFRQTQFAEFEHLIYESDAAGIPLTADYLSEQYGEINAKYYGDGVNYDDEIATEWARIPHFYYDYYVYQYATGFSAATSFSKRILEEGQPAVDAYINYLKAGSSDYPIDVLKKAGLDMTSNKPVLEALEVFEQRLSLLEQIK